MVYGDQITRTLSRLIAPMLLATPPILPSRPRPASHQIHAMHARWATSSWRATSSRAPSLAPSRRSASAQHPAPSGPHRELLPQLCILCCVSAVSQLGALLGGRRSLLRSRGTAITCLANGAGLLRCIPACHRRPRWLHPLSCSRAAGAGTVVLVELPITVAASTSASAPLPSSPRASGLCLAPMWLRSLPHVRRREGVW